MSQWSRYDPRDPGMMPEYCDGLAPDEPEPDDLHEPSDDNEPCLSDGTPVYPSRQLTRQERLQGLADRGIDTWEEKRGER